MFTDVMILANRGVALGAITVAGFVFLPVLMNLIFGAGSRQERETDPRDSIGTKLRRFRECRDVRCGHEDCQAWNTRRARFCRHCGAPMK